METAASFEVRNAPSSYPTAAGNGGHSQGDPNSADRLFPYSAGILGGTMETAASFEVRNAPSSYPTAAGNGGYRQGDPKSADRLFPYSATDEHRINLE